MLPEPLYDFTVPSIHDDTELECRIYHPLTTATPAWKGAILAHPYAPLGGCFDDPVVQTVGQVLLKHGFVLGMFNFRGAGASKGKTSWSAKAELSDYVSFAGVFIHYLNLLQPPFPSSARPQEPDRILILGGYSYGSLVASHLPPTEAIVARFSHPAQGSAEAEIRLRAKHLSTQWNTEVRRRAREQGRSPSSGRFHAMHVGGEEGEPGSRRTREPRRSLDFVRRSMERSCARLSLPKRESEDSLPSPTLAESPGTVVEPASIRTHYLLVSPLLAPVSAFVTMFTSPAISLDKMQTAHQIRSADGKFKHNPTLAVYGDGDFFTSRKKLRRWAEGIAAGAGSCFEFAEIAGAGHFWHEDGVEDRLKDSIATWLLATTVERYPSSPPADTLFLRKSVSTYVVYIQPANGNDAAAINNMSFLNHSTIFLHARPYDDDSNHNNSNSNARPNVTLTKAGSGTRSSATRDPIAALCNLVRDPLGTVSDAVQEWYAESRKGTGTVTVTQGADHRKQILYIRLQHARNYGDWKAAAMELDEVEGNNAWKTVLDSPDYDAKLIKARLEQLEEARLSGNVEHMLFLVRTALSRDLGDMGNVQLYKHTHVGTKDLIERYINAALDTLHALLRGSASPGDGLPDPRYMLEQVLQARQAFGRSALLLSGGATFGMSHNGVLKALWEANLLPRIISGASAGSIVCAVVCTRTDEEIPELLATFSHGDLAVFEEEGNEDSVMTRIARFMKVGALYDIKHLTRVMRDMLGEMTFQEAYNRTRRILNICVSSASLYELPRLLNYVTAPNVLIWSAVAASCSVPFVFSPASLLAKDSRTGETVPWNPSPQRWIDGSVDNDIPMTRLAEMFNVNHFIVSQVNPHVVPFLVKEETLASQRAQRSASSIEPGSSWLHTVAHLAKGEAIYRMHTLAELGVLPITMTKAVSVLSQKYSGDITIMPEISYADLPRMLANPAEEFINKSTLSGERATWPKLSRIRNHCAIELALDDAVQQLRTRVVFSSSQTDLRLGAYSQGMSGSKKHASGRRAYGNRSERAMSQSSEPDPSLARVIREAHFDQRRWDRQKGFAAGTRIPSAKKAAMRINTGPDASTLPEPVSSGAETSNIYTSDSDAEDDPFSSSTSSPDPPCSPSSEMARLSTSLPATPFGDYRPLGLSMTPSSPVAQRFDGAASSFKPVAAAKAAAAGAAERTYKRLFHGNGSRAHPSQAAKAHPIPKQQATRTNGRGLEIEIPVFQGPRACKTAQNVTPG